MSNLQQDSIVRCPYHLAQRYLADSIGAKAISGEQSVLTLTVSLPGMNLVKDVIVTFGTAVDPMHFDQPWHIHWKPQAGPYPDFDGQLTVRADETYKTARLELEGSYRPPGGVLGQAFDHTIGSRVASATAQALLKRLGEEMETHYQRD
ncbi:MAG TPA: hypothetical protein VHR97_02830 [Candidatus Baltobacteraceae bacterium]|jgi:hypothetical protein|nr:hypothetical protein [Candidatus Baltobacteraceae bacterium]